MDVNAITLVSILFILPIMVLVLIEKHDRDALPLYEVFNCNNGKTFCYVKGHFKALAYCQTLSKPGALFDFNLVETPPKVAMTYQRFFFISLRKIGGIRFLKLGRINISFCISKELKGF